MLQSHLLGVFENVNRVEFHEKDYEKIMSVVSKEKETIMVRWPVAKAQSDLIEFSLSAGKAGHGERPRRNLAGRLAKRAAVVAARRHQVCIDPLVRSLVRAASLPRHCSCSGVILFCCLIVRTIYYFHFISIFILLPCKQLPRPASGDAKILCPVVIFFCFKFFRDMTEIQNCFQDR